MNLDNYPTHQWTDPETNEVHEYCAASKNFANVDPNCEDWRSIHYAAEDRTYFLVRNKYTKEWQFPVGSIYFGQTILRAKQKIFQEICDGNWKVKFTGNLPQVHTMRDFTVAEREDQRNEGLKGVRTYFFHANHWRGLPDISYDTDLHDYDDYAWIPKRKLNEFFTKEYHDVFIEATTTR